MEHTLDWILSTRFFVGKIRPSRAPFFVFIFTTGMDFFASPNSSGCQPNQYMQGKSAQRGWSMIEVGRYKASSVSQ